jgi:hypothetical protein
MTICTVAELMNRKSQGLLQKGIYLNKLEEKETLNSKMALQFGNQRGLKWTQS